MTKLNHKLSLRDIAVEQVARLERKKDPEGYFKDDGRYYLTRAEYCKCCKNENYLPTVWFPRKLSTHARTIQHVANLYGVDAKALRAEVAKYNKERKKFVK